MTDEEIKKLRMRAMRKAQRHKLVHEAEDFASFASLKAIEGAKGSIDQLWIDYMRANYGDPRSKSNNGLDRMFMTPISDRSKLVAPDNTGEGVDFGFIQRFLCDNGGWFSSRDRAVITLKFKWQFNNTEIADAFGISLARVCQIVDEIEKRIRLCIETQIKSYDT